MTLYDDGMHILLSWCEFDVALFDPACGDGVDVFRVVADLNGFRFEEFFECPSGAEVWDVVSLAVACLKDSVSLDGLEFGFA